MAKRMNRGRSSESSARSRPSRGRQVRYCAVAALPGMRFRAWPGTDAPYSCTRHETTEMMTISGGSSGDAGARSRRPRACSRLRPSSPRCLSPGGPARPHQRAMPAFPRPRHRDRCGAPPPGRPRTGPPVRPLAPLPQLPAPAPAHGDRQLATRESPYDRGQAAARARRAGLHASIIRPLSRASTTRLEPQASGRTDPLVRSRTHYACRRNKLAIQQPRRR